MYLYIYDNFLTAKKYQGLLYRIENRLVDLDIKGRVVRLNILKNMGEVVENAIKQGIKTIVVVGDDSSFSKIINIIADKDIVLGIIPIDKKSKIAKILGIPPAHQACEVLAQRIIKRIDLGMVGNYYFIDSATITNEETKVKLSKYNISTTTENNTVAFNNLGVLSGLTESGYKTNPTNGELILSIKPNDTLFGKNKELTTIPFKRASVECAKPGAFIIADQTTKLKPPASIQIAAGKLRVIVGSERMF